MIGSACPMPTAINVLWVNNIPDGASKIISTASITQISSVSWIEFLFTLVVTVFEFKWAIL